MLINKGENLLDKQQQKKPPHPGHLITGSADQVRETKDRRYWHRSHACCVVISANCEDRRYVMAIFGTLRRLVEST